MVISGIPPIRKLVERDVAVYPLEMAVFILEDRGQLSVGKRIGDKFRRRGSLDIHRVGPHIHEEPLLGMSQTQGVESIPDTTGRCKGIAGRLFGYFEQTVPTRHLRNRRAIESRVALPAKERIRSLDG